MATTPSSYLTPEEFLILERQAETKHEYFDGVMEPRAGCSPRHCQIAANAAYAIGFPWRDRPFILYDSNLRIGMDNLRMITYPDLSIVRGAPQVATDEQDVLLNPFAIVEVLAPATEKYDRTGKFLRYQRIPSFAEYLLIEQDIPRVELCSRQEDGSWEWSVAEGLEATVTIPSLDCTITLADIYRNITFEEA